MAVDKKQPIVIKKVKGGRHGHHGGAWKVAYADFVTAMMAFFLLMWLLGSTSEGQKAGISDWFKNPTGIQGPGGASTSMIKLGGALEMPKGKDSRKKTLKPDMSSTEKSNQEIKESKESKAEEKSRKLEEKDLDALLQVLKKAIEKSQALKPFKDQLLLDITPEGLRIQIVDKENRPMFGLASSTLKPYMKGILREITKIIRKVPNRISISGHTDVTNFVKGYYREYEDVQQRVRYTNWELSADRANAARREMVKDGLPEGRVGRVIGLASSVLFDKKNPKNPINRRISIIVMNKSTEKSIGLSDRKTAKISDVKQLLNINKKKQPATVDELEKLLPGKQFKVR